MKKGGRPKKCQDLKGKELEKCIEENVFNKIVPIKFTKKDYDFLYQNYLKVKGNLNISFAYFLRNLIMDKDFSIIKERENKAHLIKEINKIGININQIIKKIHSFNVIDNNLENEVKILVEKLDDIIKIVFDIKEK